MVDTTSKPNEVALVAAVVAGIERDQHVSTWPQDEQDFFRDYSQWNSFQDRHDKLQVMRAQKIIDIVRKHDRNN